MSHQVEEEHPVPIHLDILREIVPEAERRPVIQDCTTLPFGKFFSDHMFTIHFSDGHWQQGKISKVEPFQLHPAALVLHYAQEIFEGLKCFRKADGELVMFRPQKNIKRMNDSARRLCMPTIDEDYFLKAMKELVIVDQRHVPTQAGTSLYIRPFMIATEPILGVRASHDYIFCILTCPVGPYFVGGFKPTRIYIQHEYCRSAPGGTGAVKTGGNYATSLYAYVHSHDKGCSQVLWLDAVERKYIEEVGAMNIAFVINGTVVTPPLRGTILPGVTRDSMIQICKDLHIPVEERPLSTDELVAGIKSGALTEAFGCGTAASIAPVGEILVEDELLPINNNQIGPISQRLYDTIVGVQRGDLPDEHHWDESVEEKKH